MTPAEESQYLALANAYRDLRADNDGLSLEREALKDAVIKMAAALGFTGEEAPGQIGPKILKQVPKMMAEYTLNPEKFKARFNFLQDLAPILKNFIKEE